MKPTPSPKSDLSSLLVFGAHPDDIEFGCGGVIALEARSGRAIHFVITSRGEAGSNGTPEERTAETEAAAALLGATVEFIELDGDAHLEVRAAHAIKLASIIRRIKPSAVLAPTLEQNQHPDHWRLGQLVRDATRLARYGGLPELRSQASHAIGQLFFYAITPQAEPKEIQPVLIDVSAPDVMKAWTVAMKAHRSQLTTRDYPALQLARAQVNGSLCAVAAAIALYPNDPLVFDSLSHMARGARHF